MPTDEELIALGKKVLAAKEKEKVRTKAVSVAIKRLIDAYRDEFEGYLEAAKKPL